MNPTNHLRQKKKKSIFSKEERNQSFRKFKNNCSCLLKWHPLSDAVVLDYQINSVHVILLRNNTQHNIEGLYPCPRGIIQGLLGSFHKPSEATCGCSAVSYLHTAHAGWYSAAQSCTCTPQRARVPTSATNEAAYMRFCLFCSKLHPCSQGLLNTHMKIQPDVLFLQLLSPFFTASEALQNASAQKREGLCCCMKSSHLASWWLLLGWNCCMFDMQWSWMLVIQSSYTRGECCVADKRCSYVE